jgi:hypothetical protein
VSLAIDRVTVESRARQTRGESGDAIYRAIVQALSRRGIRGHMLVDVGCGAGRLWPFVCDRFATYVGVDVVRYEEFPNQPTFLQVDCDAGAVPLPDQSADVVVAAETIEHLENLFVPATTIDMMVETLGVVPTHIKIDVEGEEAAVIRSGRRTLSSAGGPLLFVELHHAVVGERGGDTRATLELLRECGYVAQVNEGQAGEDASVLDALLVRVLARRTTTDKEARRA